MCFDDECGDVDCCICCIPIPCCCPGDCGRDRDRRHDGRYRHDPYHHGGGQPVYVQPVAVQPQYGHQGGYPPQQGYYQQGYPAQGYPAQGYRGGV